MEQFNWKEECRLKIKAKTESLLGGHPEFYHLGTDLWVLI